MKNIESKPNVILMFVDDLGYGDIQSFNESGKISTPNIDRLASGGMKFTDSHACSALCTPSRYGLLTGRYNWRSRLKFLVLPGDSNTLIEKDRMTMADVFKKANYNTACVGKWHLGLEWIANRDPKPSDFGVDSSDYENLVPRSDTEPSINMAKVSPINALDIDYTKPIAYGPNQYGFDYFFGLPASLDQPPYVYIENDRVLELPDHISGVVKLDRDTGSMMDKWQRGPIAPSYDHEQVLDDMNDKVIELIDTYAEKEEPFFIYYPTPAVHGPLLPNKKNKGRSGINAYADIVMQLDDMVGQITEKLEEKNILEDTIFIFTSDNGCSGVADYPTLLENGHNPSYKFRGKKFSLYEGGHRVPTIVHYPKMIQENTTCDSNVCHTDFFRTFAEMLQVELPQNAAEDSFSNLNLWKQDGSCDRKATVYTCGAGYFGIAAGQWKLNCCTNGGIGREAMESAFKKVPYKQDFELYNVYEDISEEHNVIEENSDVVQELKAELTRCLDQGRSTDGEMQKNFIPPYPWVQINWK